MTPSQMPYPQRTVADIGLLDLNGNVISGTRRTSSEGKMHLAIYKARLDVNRSSTCTRSTSPSSP